MTSGLTSVGDPVDDDEGGGEGMDGRQSNLRATAVCADGVWNVDEYSMRLQGPVRQAIL